MCRRHPLSWSIIFIINIHSRDGQKHLRLVLANPGKQVPMINWISSGLQSKQSWLVWTLYWDYFRQIARCCSLKPHCWGTWKELERQRSLWGHWWIKRPLRETWLLHSGQKINSNTGLVSFLSSSQSTHQISKEIFVALQLPHRYNFTTAAALVPI